MGIVENEVLAYLRKFDAASFDVELDKKTSHIGKDESYLKLSFADTPEVYDLLDNLTLTLGEAYISGNLNIEGYDDEQNALVDAAGIFLGQPGNFVKRKYKNGKKISAVKSFRIIQNEMRKYCQKQEELVIEELLEKSELKKGMTVCDIGCEYEDFLIKAAIKYNIKGVMVTYNKKKREILNKKISENNLQDLLEVKYIKYGKIPKLSMKFDRIICINALNHIKVSKYNRFFDNAGKMLNENGRMIAAVMHNPHGYVRDSWINKYVFRGAVYPKLTYVLKKASKAGFSIKGTKSLRKNYSLRYLEWYKSITEDRENLSDRFGDRDIRIFELYLCGFAAAFKVCFLDVNIIFFE